MKKNINYSCTETEKSDLDKLVADDKKKHVNPTDKNCNRGTVISALIADEIERRGL